MLLFRWLVVLLLALGSVAGARTLTVITHSSFDLDPALVKAFERQYGATVRFVKGGDAGQMLNRLILTRRAPVADAVYGLDNTLLGRALANDLLVAYRSPRAARIPAAYRLDPSWRLTPVDYGFVALNYDRAWFRSRGRTPPQSLEDLAKPEFRDLLVAPNPATSSPGLAFFLATVKSMGETAALGYWARLRDNGLKVVPGWTEAYQAEFSRNGGGRPIVVSYASSPAAEVFYADPRPAEPPTANLLVPGSAFRQVEGVGVLKGAREPELARRWVDFMLSEAVQRDFPTRMWVYPVMPGVTLDPVFRFAQRPAPEAVATPSPATIAARAEALVDAWTRVVVQGEKPPARVP